MTLLKEELRQTVEKMRAARHLWPFYLQQLALENGLVGHTEYQRFIVLGRSRVGSNFLRGLLNSHSQIRVFGELFQNKEEIGWAMPGYRQSARLLALFHRDPVRFLESKVFRRFPTEVAAVGFKIFYYHALDGEWKQLWDHLRDMKELKVIHLKRWNILETHLSRKKAQLTDVWVNLGNGREKQQPIELDYEACLEDFVRTREWERYYDDLFSGHRKIELFYEELSHDYRAEIRKVQEFLGVRFEPVMPQTYKQGSLPLSHAIANYEQLKERFRGTPWESFFTG